MHICFEGLEGTFKSTTAAALNTELQKNGFKTILTKEPGTPHIPLTMELRRIMLDSKYESQMTVAAREFVSQAIRSIHLEHLIEPSRNDESIDFIIQDRGILSGVAYGQACGFTSLGDISDIMVENTKVSLDAIKYDLIVYLYRTDGKGLETAVNAKSEFDGGDAMELRGLEFQDKVEVGFKSYLECIQESDGFGFSDGLLSIDVTGKSTDTIVKEITDYLNA